MFQVQSTQAEEEVKL